MTALVPHGDDEALCYLSPEKPSAFASAASETTGIEQVRRAGDERVQAVVTEPIPCNVVTSHGGTIRQAHIESTSSTVVVRFPDGEAFDPVLDALAQRFDDVGIADFTTAAADTDDDSEPLGRLTDRQREVLEVAFRSGYFEKPRPNDATAVAETLDIARPTYDEILRAAQRNLLSELFDGE
jgi:predicted DNA binding protein